MNLTKKGVKKAIPYEKTITFEPDQWSEIEKLNLSDLRRIVRAHGFQSRNDSGTSKEEEREY